MSLVIDTSALMARLLNESDAVLFAQALHDATELRMSAPTWLDAAQVATARRGVGGYEQFAGLIASLNVEIVPCDAPLARIAYGALLQFGKGRHPAGLNFGDCFSYGLAKLRSEPLLFKGEDFSKTDIVAAVSASG